MSEVYLSDQSRGDNGYYVVMVDGQSFDELFCDGRLTLSEQVDVADAYCEALDGTPAD